MITTPTVSGGPGQAPSGLDLAVLNSRRHAVVALRDDLWRASAAAERTFEVSDDAHVAALTEPMDLDYGVLSSGELVPSDVERSTDLGPEL